MKDNLFKMVFGTKCKQDDMICFSFFTTRKVA